MEELFVGLLGTENFSRLVDGLWEEAAIEEGMDSTVVCSDCPPSEEALGEAHSSYFHSGSRQRGQSVPDTGKYLQLSSGAAFYREPASPRKLTASSTQDPGEGYSNCNILILLREN